MSKDFFALISRMKYIHRWALMRNTQAESLCQHSFETAIVAHALAVLSNKRLGSSLDAERAALLGLYHDAPEILTGDLPTPVKYYSAEISGAFKNIEETATNKLLSLLPEDLRDEYEGILKPREEDEELRRLVKAADKLSALIKCIEEEKAGNSEFSKARDASEKALRAMDCEAAELFIKEFLPSYLLTLDQLK